MRIAAYMLSCAARSPVRARSLACLAATDWASEPVVVLDEAVAKRSQDRQVQTANRLLELAAADDADFLLFLEDDLLFNRHLRHNLTHWLPVCAAGTSGFMVGSLYNPGVHTIGRDRAHAFGVAHSHFVFGSQAFLLSQATVLKVIDGWESVAGAQDIRIARLAGAVSPFYYHQPSLVQHMDVPSTWGGRPHRARDFSATWRAQVG